VREAALIEATLVCLRKYGHTGVSIRRISAEAGVSVGLINHYYPQKASLVAIAYEKLSISLLQSYQQRAELEALSPQERLQHFFRAWFAPDQLTPEMFQVWLVFWGAAHSDPEMRSTYKQMRRLYRVNLERMLGDLRTSPDVQPFDLRQAAIGLSALLDGLWLQLGLDHTALKPIEAIRACEYWVHTLRTGEVPRSDSSGPSTLKVSSA
jgi:AcrR family transcriptional regulator